MNAETKQNRAYHLEKFGGLDGLVNGAIAIPTPASGEVVVRVRASSLNSETSSFCKDTTQRPYHRAPSLFPMVQVR